MSPSAEPANPPAEAEAVVPAKLLEDGEVVILAVKPSLWYVLLASWPVVVLAALVAGVSYAAAELFAAAINLHLVLLGCAAVACTGVTVASFQWQGRLYVLTNRRTIRLRGVFRPQVSQCLLRHIRRTHVSATLTERMVGVGTLLFEAEKEACGDHHWVNLARPAEVQRIVEETLRRTG